VTGTSWLRRAWSRLISGQRAESIGNVALNALAGIAVSLRKLM
jgi:hypothetical protein